ncbi:MAG: hypothetical protein WC511_00950 [Candidatus Pacearchaeota archaeon]
MKSLTKKLLGAVAGIGLFLTPVQKNSAEIYGFLGAGYGHETQGNYSASVDSVPEIVRDVPAHPDDFYKTRPQDVGPIADTDFDLPFSGRGMNVELKAGVGIRKGIFDFKLGPKISLSSKEDVVSSIKERNYLNHPGTEERGYGAALTYYKMKSESTSDIPFGGLAEFSLNFDLSDGHGLCLLNPFVEYSFLVIPKEFYFETGWDRHDSLEKRKSYKITPNLLSHTAKAGAKIILGPWNISVYGGAEILQSPNTTDLGKEADFSVDSRPKWFAGVFTGFYLDNIMFRNMMNN